MQQDASFRELHGRAYRIAGARLRGSLDGAAMPVPLLKGRKNPRAYRGDRHMYYEIEVVRWCILLKREARMRLTYRRDYIPEVKQWRDFLVNAQPVE